MPPKQLYRCICTSRKCRNSRTPDGQTGVMVDARTLRDHTKADQIAAARIRATETEAKFKANYEADLAERVDSLMLSNPDPSAVPGAVRPLKDLHLPQYNIDQARTLIEIATDIQNNLKSLHDDVVKIGHAPVRTCSTDAATKALRGLELIRSSVLTQSRELQQMSSSKIPSVVAMYQEVWKDLDDVKDLLKEVRKTWEAVLQDEAAKLAASQQQANQLAAQAGDAVAGDAKTQITAHHFKPILGGVLSFLQIVILMIAACHIILRLPRRGTSWLFSMCKTVIETVLDTVIGLVPLNLQNPLKNFPRDIRAALAQLDLEGQATVYAACPGCHAIYKPTIVDGIPTYPEKCSARRHGTRCKQLLVRPKTVGKHKVRVYTPIRPFISFDFKDWLAGLLSRCGYEKMMDKAWDKMELPADGRLNDIFQGSNVRGFMGPDKKHFSLSGGDGAGRYLFSLSFDFFNPLRNIAAGKKKSVGVITLACLNIPMEERYKPENLFLEVVPGPQEPPLDSVSHYLEPVVDAFVDLWYGVLFDKTCECALGRMVLCAIIAVVCDLPGARKVGGFAHHAHEYFCSRCKCRRSIHGYTDYDYRSWELRKDDECRASLESYQKAESTEAADELFAEAGMRYSELVRLPYYNPSTFLVVDIMHNLFLGLIEDHVHKVLGYQEKQGPKKAKAVLEIQIDTTTPLPTNDKCQTGIRQFLNFMKKPLQFDNINGAKFAKALTTWSNRTQLDGLKYIAGAIGCVPVANDGAKLLKVDYARAILQWRVQQVESPIFQAHGNVVTKEEMEAVRGDLQAIVKPSWVTSVPTLLPSGPKLKSDQWRMVGALYLPVTLIRIWSISPDPQRRAYLHLTMLLLSAVVIASSRVTSPDHSIRYLQLMTEYRQHLQHLFPDYPLVPNNHMAFHIPEFMERYGPAPGWWAFPYERVIGMLGRFSTNYKQGEYEQTIVRSWHRTSNFRGMFLKQTCPEAIRMCANMFRKLVRPQTRYTLTLDALLAHEDHEDGDEEDDIQEDDVQEEGAEEDTANVKDHLNALVGKAKPVAHDLRTVFRRALRSKVVPTTAHFPTHLSDRDISYTTRERHEGNSCILFKGSDTPYSIRNIVQFPATHDTNTLQGTWIVVQRHRVARLASDPYEAYPELGARIWQEDYESNLEVRPMSDVDAHFAKCQLPGWESNEAVIVIVSLRREK